MSFAPWDRRAAAIAALLGLVLLGGPRNSERAPEVPKLGTEGTSGPAAEGPESGIAIAIEPAPATQSTRGVRADKPVARPKKMPASPPAAARASRPTESMPGMTTQAPPPMRQPEPAEHAATADGVHAAPGTMPTPDQQSAHKPAAAQPASTPPTAANPGPSSAANGEKGPLFVARFDALGVDEFVRVIERTGGALFALDLATRGIGPRLWIADNRIGGSADRFLAFERPYLARDSSLADRLARFDLPLGMSRDAVVVLWSTWMDRLVWGEVAEVCRAHGISIDDLARIHAAYVRLGDGTVGLRIEAVERRSGNPLAVARLIRLPS